MSCGKYLTYGVFKVSMSSGARRKEEEKERWASDGRDSKPRCRDGRDAPELNTVTDAIVYMKTAWARLLFSHVSRKSVCLENMNVRVDNLLLGVLHGQYVSISSSKWMIQSLHD